MGVASGGDLLMVVIEMDDKSAIQEISSGGVLMRRHLGRMQVCLIATRGGRRWQLPKGHVEQGEQPHQTAVREVMEETGCEGRVLELIDTIHYGFFAQHDKQAMRHSKLVYFYLMQYEMGQTSTFDWEVDATKWFSPDEALAKLSYDNERDILRRAIARFKELVPPPPGIKEHDSKDEH